VVVSLERCGFKACSRHTIRDRVQRPEDSPTRKDRFMINRITTHPPAAFRLSIAVSAFVTAVVPLASSGAIVVTVEQRGSDVVIDYSGSWDSWSGSSSSPGFGDTAVDGGGLYNLPDGASNDFIGTGLSLSSGQWTNTLTNADSSSGDSFSWNSSATGAPLNYTAGNQISGSLTFNGTDLATMGFTPGDSGTFTGGGNTANFSVSAVPEPTSIAFMATGGLAAGVVAVARRRRRTGADS